MPLPTITGIARLVDDPELRFTSSGKAVASVRLAFNSRRLNKQTDQWEDADVFWVRGTAWEQMAENCAETLAKGMEVLVSGELKTQSWEDKEGGKRQTPELAIRSIGPNLAYATAQVAKSTSGSNQGQQGGQQTQRPQQGQQRQQTPQDDPWATATPASRPATNSQGNAASNWGNDQPPF